MRLYWSQMIENEIISYEMSKLNNHNNIRPDLMRFGHSNPSQLDCEGIWGGCLTFCQIRAIPKDSNESYMTYELCLNRNKH